MKKKQSILHINFEIIKESIPPPPQKRTTKIPSGT